MSGATAGGLPYPSGADKVRDGDNAIQALADALEARGHGMRIVRESFVATPDGGGTFSHAFPGGAFTAAPSIAVTAGSAAAGTVIVFGLQNVDAAGFSGNLAAAVVGGGVQGRTTPTWIYYIAVGPK